MNVKALRTSLLLNRFLTKKNIFTINNNNQLLKKRFYQITLFNNDKIENHLKSFEQIFQEDTSTTKKGGEILYNPEIDKSYNKDWTGQFEGHSPLILRPRTTEQVSKIVKYCYNNNIVIIPQGGNTNLCGASIPLDQEIRPQLILSLNLMNEIISFNKENATLICQSGCILEQLNKYFLENNLSFQMPLDLAAKGTCQIGGNIATGAGGIRYIRFGSLHANLLGLECILPNGDILNTIKEIRKDNTGYHLSHLFIGSEGTLGIITKVALKIPLKLKANNVMLLGVNSFHQVKEIIQLAKLELGEIISAIEFFDSQCMELVSESIHHTTIHHTTNNNTNNNTTTHNNELFNGEKYNFYMVLETQGSNQIHDEEKLNNFFEKVLSNNLAEDGNLAFDETQALHLWKYRESISENLKRRGHVYKYDISLPLQNMYDIVIEMRNRLNQHFNNNTNLVEVYGYGHLADENLHLNITSSKYDEKVKELIEPFIYEYINKCNGSISAEHGIGLLKKDYLKYSQSNVAINLMKSMKKMLDPKNIMNPNKIFDL
ncbi:hypothetical protein ABK040_004196 [Willaertia magna]